MYLLSQFTHLHRLIKKIANFLQKAIYNYILSVLNQVMKSIQSSGICLLPAVTSTVLKGRRLSILYSQHLTDMETISDP